MQYRETCPCGARIEIDDLPGLAGSPSMRVQEFRDAHADCRRAWALRKGEYGTRWDEAACDELPDLEDPQ